MSSAFLLEMRASGTEQEQAHPVGFDPGVRGHL